MRIAKKRYVRAVSVGFAVGASALLTQPASAMANLCESELVNDSGSCGADRGNYILRSSGRALYAREDANNSDHAELVIRRPNATGGLVEDIIARYGDTVSNRDGSFSATLGGLGSNPHMNNAGQAVWQVVSRTNDTSSQDIDTYTWGGFYAGTSPSSKKAVLGAFDSLDGYTVCAGDLEPWPQIGDGGHIVVGTSVAKGSQRACKGQGDDLNRPSNLYRRDYKGDGALGQVASISVDSSKYTVTMTSASPALPDPMSSNVDLLIAASANTSVPAASADIAFGGVQIGSVRKVSASNITRIGDRVFEVALGEDLPVSCDSPPCTIDLATRLSKSWLYDEGASSPDLATRYLGGQKAVFRIPYDNPASGSAVLYSDHASVANNLPLTFAAGAAALGAGHPLASSSPEFHLREVDAIAHSGDMVAADGALVAQGYLQLLPQAGTLNPARYFGTGDTAVFSDEKNFSYTSILHVDAAGDASLVATSGGSVAKVTAPLIAPDGRVIYREGSQSDYGVDGTTDVCYPILPGNYPFDAAPTFADPTLAATVEAGEYGTRGNLSIRTGTAGTGWGTVNCRSDGPSCGIVLRQGGASSTAADYVVAVRGYQQACSNSTQEAALDSAVASGGIKLRIPSSTLRDVLGLVGSSASEEFATVPAASFGPKVRYRYVPPGAVKAWDPVTGTASTVVDVWAPTPAGFSRIDGVPPHYDAGEGIVAFKAGLESPYHGAAGGGATDNPYPAVDFTRVATALSSFQPCADVSAGRFDDSPRRRLSTGDNEGEGCQAIYLRTADGLVEIARSKTAEVTFRAEDDPTRIGVTEADGFEFWEFGSTTIVADNGTVFFVAMTGQPQAGACAEASSKNYEDEGYHGIFSYRDGVVRKVVAQCDVLSNGFQVVGLQLPQPELRQAAYGNNFLVKALLDTDEDGIDDTIALLGLTAADPASPTSEPGVAVDAERGPLASTFSQQGGDVTLRVLDPAGAALPTPGNGWVLTSIEVADASSASFLPAGASFPDGLVSFTASSGEPGSVLYLSLTFPTPVASVAGLLKDVPGAPDLLESVEDNGQGGSLVTFAIQDNGPYDFDDRDGFIRDPVALSVLLASAPIPTLTWPLLALLSGLLSLVGAAVTGRRR